MKKNCFFYAALFAAALSFGLTSCGVEDDPGIVLDDTIKPTVIDDIQKLPTNVTLPAAKQEPAVVEMSEESPVSKILLGSDSKALVFTKSVAARAIVDGTNVYTGTYTITSEGYVVECPELGASIIVPFDLVGDIQIGEDAYAIEESLKVPDSATPAELSICRTWGNPSYTAGVFFDKLPVYGTKDEEKASVQSIQVLAKKVLDRIVAQDSSLRDEGFKLLSSEIESLTFTSQKVFVRFTDKRVEESVWSWTDQSKGQLKTVIDGKDVALEARFEAPNKAYFIVTANCEGVGGLGVHTLSGKLICTMTDSSTK